MSQGTNAGWIESLKRFALGMPVLFSIVVLILSSLLVEISFDVPLRPLLGERAARLCKVTLGHTLTGLLLFWLLVKLGLLQDARFIPPRQWKAVWLVWPLFLRVNSIWPTIVLHAAIDFSDGLRHIAVGEQAQRAVANSTVGEALISGLIVGLPVLLYGLFILRKVEPDCSIPSKAQSWS